MSDELKITFLPEDRTVYVLPGTTVLEAALRVNIILQSPCGGKGTCGKCRVRIREGASAPTPTEAESLDETALADGVRLACQARVTGESVVEILNDSRQSGLQILDRGLEGEQAVRPGVVKKYAEIEPPTLESARSDAALLAGVLGPEKTAGLGFLRNLPRFLRDNGFKGTFTAIGNELVEMEPGDTSAECYGVALDIGTTTMVGTLMRLPGAQVLGTVARLNPQSSMGADLISRIDKVLADRSALQELHDLVTGEVNDMVRELSETAGIRREHICDMTVTGNSVMQHLFLKVTPEYLGTMPFVPAVREGVTVRAGDLDIGILPAAGVRVFPSIAGFVGGDTVACILASRLHRTEGIRLLVDIGTNGEIVLGGKDGLTATSTAAGPAFEGARISQGMQGVPGAIEKVVINPQDDAAPVVYNVIGNTAPAGICGSGLIDAVAGLLRAGIIDETGRLVSAEELDAACGPALKSRIVERNGENAFQLVPDPAPVFLTQRDIRELQLGKGAIYTGVRMLEKTMGITDADIDEVYLAGGFGNFIRRKNAITVGLIPDLPHEKIKYIGNAALAGAQLALLSTDQYAEAGRISAQAGYIELSQDPEFQMQFAEAMLFTHE